MAYPQDWDAVRAKLKQLYPVDSERGKVRYQLSALDEGTVLEYFEDTDAAV